MPHVAKCVMKLSFEQLAYFEGSCSSQTEVIIVDTASFFLLHLPLILDNVVCVLDLGLLPAGRDTSTSCGLSIALLYLFVCLSLSVGCREISQSLFLYLRLQDEVTQLSLAAAFSVIAPGLLSLPESLESLAAVFNLKLDRTCTQPRLSL